MTRASGRGHGVYEARNGVKVGVLNLQGRIFMPETDDPSYQSAEHLGGHVFRAARNYLTWIGEFVNRPVTDVDSDTDAASIAGKSRVFVDGVLLAWRRHLALLEDRELAPATRKSRWGGGSAVSSS